MMRSRTMISLLAVISLFASVIWHNAAFAAGAPALKLLGQVGDMQTIPNPTAIAVDGQGNVFITVSTGILELNQYGRVEGEFAKGLASGRGVAVSADGVRLYVATTAGEVLVIDPQTGSELGKLAGAPVTDGGGEFNVPGYIVVDGAGYVYVADTGRMLIKVYTADGNFLNQFGGIGTANGQFTSIAGLAINPVTQQVAVVDGQGERVEVFGLDGTFVKSLDRSTQLGTPVPLSLVGVAADGLGRSYVLDGASTQLTIIDSAYANPAKFDLGGFHAKDAAFDGLNNRFLVVADEGKVYSVGIDGGVNPVWVNTAPSVPQPTAPLAGSVVGAAQPQLQFAAATDADGDALTYDVQVLDAAGVVAEMTGVSATTVAPTVALTENGSFSWKVRAFDGTDYSAWSDAVSFAVNAVAEAPTAPVLVAPLRDAVAAGTDQLVWQAASDPDPGQGAALKYRLAVAGATGFAAPVLQAETSGQDLGLGSLAGYDKLVPGTVYAWQVTAIDADGLETTSSTGSFTYQPSMLTVATNMPGARVYLGGNPGYSGQFVGVAPVELRDLAAGTYSVVIECAGFEPFFAMATLPEQGSAAVNAKLVPARAVTELEGNTLQAGGAPAAVATNAVPALVDFNNDGLVDLVVGDANGSLQLFAGTADGFAAAQDLGLPQIVGAAPVVVDWNDDNRKDLLVGAADGTVELFLNVGSDEAPQFDAGRQLTAGGAALTVGAAAVPVVFDIDGNGIKDLVVGSAAGQLVLFKNVGDDAAPQLGAGVQLGQLNAAVAPFSFDWNGDGQRELLAVTGGQVAQLGADADGHWGVVGTLPLPAAGVVAASGCDLDGQGGMDLVLGLASGGLQLATAEVADLVPAFSGALAQKVGQVSDSLTTAAPGQSRLLAMIASSLESGALSVPQAEKKLRASLLGVSPSTETAELLQILDQAVPSTGKGRGKGRMMASN